MDEMGFVTSKLVQWVLWAGPFGIAALLGAIGGAAFYAGSAYVGYLIGGRGK